LVVRKRLADGAKYFGPYSGTSIAYTIVNTTRKVFGIPDCKKQFPRDIGKTRPCLNHQIGLCCGLCTSKLSREEYRAHFKDILPFLGGAFADVKRSLTEQMEYAAENLMFEAAALCRDRIRALSKLWEKQKVVAAPFVEQDVIALHTDETSSCLAVFYIRNGAVTDNESFVFGADTIVDEEAIASFLYELYRVREYIPREILLDFPLGAESLETLSVMLREKAGYKVTVRFPEKGNLKQLCAMVRENAKEYATQYNQSAEKQNDTLIRLAQLLQLEVVPEKIESFDISNYGNENITAGKVRMENGKFVKSAYRTYKIQGSQGQDDYASMREAVERRLNHPEDEYPDLFLLDGGKAHVSVIRQLLDEMGIDIPVYGMVKDDYHKTRALIGEDEEISIAKEQNVFLLIYKLQEEVHRYTVSRMTGAKRKTLRASSLTEINGIGPAKAKELLSHFKGLRGVSEASLDELTAVKGISQKDAETIIQHFAAKKGR
ncbi:MAG: excinuclease ABC subunit C, partial [Clostridia bacterium]|nr:excinuclease ABC subunit C [Clostridia bacterium]